MHLCQKPRTGLSTFARSHAGTAKRKATQGLPMPLDVHMEQAMDVTGHSRTEVRGMSFKDGQLVKICEAGGSPCKYYTAKVRFSPVAADMRRQHTADTGRAPAGGALR